VNGRASLVDSPPLHAAAAGVSIRAPFQRAVTSRLTSRGTVVPSGGAGNLVGRVAAHPEASSTPASNTAVFTRILLPCAVRHTHGHSTGRRIVRRALLDGVNSTSTRWSSRIVG
jgi:hypothetical protein